MELNPRIAKLPEALTAQCLTLMGRAETWLADPQAIATQRRALAMRTRLHGADHADSAESSIALGFAIWKTGSIDQWPEAEAFYRDGIETYRRIGVTCSSDFARAVYSLASFLHATNGNDAERQQLVREAATCYKQLTETPDRYRVSAQLSYANDLMNNRKIPAAKAELAALMRITPYELDVEESVRQTLWTLGRMELLQSNQPEAFYAFRRALRGECRAQALGEVEVRRWLLAAQMIQASENMSDLLHALRELLPLLEAIPRAEMDLLTVNIATAASLAATTDAADTLRELIDELMEIQQKHPPITQHCAAMLQSVTAETLYHTGQFEPALRQWIQAYRTISNAPHQDALLIQPTIRGIVKANEAMGRTNAADHYRSFLLSWD